MAQPNKIIPHKKYNILASHSGKSLDVYGGFKSTCANLIQFSFHGAENQQFIFEPADNGYYMIKCVHSGLYWDIYGSRQDNCTTLIQFSKHGGHNQQFRLDSRGNGLYAIIVRHSQKALDITGGSHSDRVNVIQFQFHGNSNQLFRIQLTKAEQEAIRKIEKIRHQKEIDELKRKQQEADRLHQQQMAELRRQQEEEARRQQAEAQRRQAEAERRHQQQIDEIRRQQQQAAELQKQQLMQQLSTRKNDLLLQKHDIQTEYNINHETLMAINQQIMTEEKEIYNFAEERNDKSTKIIILMGNTGDGKSTFGNRLMDDTSEEADKGAFKTSDDNKSCTEALEKYKHGKTSIVDAPGWNDYNGNDRTHVNNLCAYLKGCGGINAFVVVRNASNCRFDADFQNKLKQFENAFGADFWLHLIVVLTHVDKGIAEKKFKKANKVQQVKDDLSKLCGGLNSNVPVISIGLDNYDDKISKFMDAVPNKRFICDNIKSPIDDLKMKKQEFVNKENKLKQKIQRIENTISKVISQMNAL